MKPQFIFSDPDYKIHKLEEIEKINSCEELYDFFGKYLEVTKIK